VLVREKDSKRAASSDFGEQFAKLLCLDSGETEDGESAVRASCDETSSTDFQRQQLRLPEVGRRNALKKLRVLCFFP
jgi:hypothetical protein